MTKKLKLLFVVCFVSIALGLSAGKVHAASIATADASLALLPYPQPFVGPVGSYDTIWTKSFSVALAANNVPTVVGPVVDISGGIAPTFAAAGVLPGPTAAGVAGTSQVFFPSTLFSPNLMQSVSAVFPVWPNSALAFSAAGYLGKLTSTADGNLIGLSALDALILNLSTDFIGESAAGFAVAGLFVKNLSTGSLGLDYDLVYNAVWDGNDFSFSTNFPPNTLTAGTLFSNEDEGIWGAFVATGVKAEPVPEPATMALFGMGMVGLVGAGVRRKFKKKEVVKS